MSDPLSPVVHATLTDAAVAKILARGPGADAEGKGAEAEGEGKGKGAEAKGEFKGEGKGRAGDPATFAEQSEALARVCERALALGLAVAAPKLMKGEQRYLDAAPSLRLAVRATLPEPAIRAAVTWLKEACADVIR